MQKSFLFILFFIITPVFAGAQIDTNSRLPVNQTELDSVNALSDQEKMLFYKNLCWESRLYNSKAAIQYGTMALELSQKLNEVQHEASILNFLGVASRNMNNYPVALEYYFKAKNLAKKNNLRTEEAYAYNNIGDICSRENNYTAAIENINQALKLFTQDSNKAGMAYCNNQLGIVMKNMGKDSLALTHFFKTLELRKTLKDTIKMAVAYNSIGEIYHLQNKLSLAKKNYEESIQLLEKETGDYRSISVYFFNIGRYYLQLGSLQKAKDNFLKSFDLSTYYEFNDVSSKTALSLSNIYLKEKNFEKAFKFLSFHKTLSDSIITEENTAKVTRMEMQHKYDEELKEREIIELRNYAILSFIIIIVLSVAVGLFRINTIKQRANIKLAEKTEKIVEQQEELTVYYEELKENNQTKDKFFSIIAHDLKNPFNSISGFAGLILHDLEANSYENIERFAKIIQKASEQNYSLLMNLLEWARSQTGDIKYYPETFKIGAFINDVIEQQNGAAIQKSIRINNSIEDDEIYADKNMLNTVFRNLLSNAIKYSYPKKTIYFSSEKHPDFIHFSVKDEGTGIQEKKLNKLFSLEQNLSMPGTNEETGTGLGLLLCKEFVEKHNGQIWVKSTVGKGTTFSFSIPRKSMTMN
jgi:signal transduction histidine kinase/Flp pilus assembly protein TadD